MRPNRSIVAVWILSIVTSLPTPAAADGPLEDVSLAVPPILSEASGLLTVERRALLEAAGVDRAFWVVGDRGRAEHVLSFVGRRLDVDGSPTWSVWPALVTATTPDGDDPERTEDAESLFRQGDVVYVVGSHFGKKGGPLQIKRQFFARFDEAAVGWSDEGPRVAMEVVRDDFELHRVVNDALAASGHPMIAATDELRDAFIAETTRLHAKKKKEKKWVEQISPGDTPIDIEGAAASTDDRVWLGLRYPVTAAGEPVIVEVAGVPGLFDGAGRLSAGRVVVLKGVGSVDAPRGVRALDWLGGQLHVVSGGLDSKSEQSARLRAHPEGSVARSLHSAGAIGEAFVEVRADFDEARDVEGIAFPSSGAAHYVRDEPDEIRLLIAPAP